MQYVDGSPPRLVASRTASSFWFCPSLALTALLQRLNKRYSVKMLAQRPEPKVFVGYNKKDGYVPTLVGNWVEVW